MSNKKTLQESFSERLDELMNNKYNISPLKRKITQAELADEICNKGIPIKRQTISLYINGKAMPDLEKFKIIADFFRVPYEYLFGTSEVIDRDNVQIANELGLKEEAIEVLKNFKRNASSSDEMIAILNRQRLLAVSIFLSNETIDFFGLVRDIAVTRLNNITNLSLDDAFIEAADKKIEFLQWQLQMALNKYSSELIDSLIDSMTFGESDLRSSIPNASEEQLRNYTHGRVDGKRLQKKPPFDESPTEKMPEE